MDPAADLRVVQICACETEAVCFWQWFANEVCAGPAEVCERVSTGAGVE